MNARRLALPLVFAVATACSGSDLYPVTREVTAAGGGGSGVSNVSGGAGSGTGTGTGGASAGGSGAGGAGTGGVGAAAPACSNDLAPPGDSTHSVRVAGTTRSYLLHLPAGYDGAKPSPLVLDFHGVGETGASERSSSPYPAVLDPEGVIQAFPDGARGPAGTAWNVGPCCVADVDDVAFARAVVQHVASMTCVDPSRVYAVGVLTGGGLAHYLACHAADVFAAVAPAAFDLLAENVDDCVPMRPITSISFRGTGNSRVPYEGGRSSLVPGMPLTFLGARATFETWSTLNGCTGPASVPDANGCSSYSGCRDGVEVILCTKQGGTEEPGDAAIAWPVLARHRLD